MSREKGIMKEQLRKLYPPGFEWREELISAAVLFGLAVLLSWQYLFRLGRMTHNLYTYDRYGERFIRPDAWADSYSELIQGSFWGFLLPVVFLAVMVIWHYISYWRQAKSIYVMRRLPKRGVVFFSCIKGPVLCVALLALAAGILWILYLGLYWLVVPAECIPRLV